MDISSNSDLARKNVLLFLALTSCWQVFKTSKFYLPLNQGLLTAWTFERLLIIRTAIFCIMPYICWSLETETDKSSVEKGCCLSVCTVQTNGKVVFQRVMGVFPLWLLLYTVYTLTHARTHHTHPSTHRHTQIGIFVYGAIFTGIFHLRNFKSNPELPVDQILNVCNW